MMAARQLRDELIVAEHPQLGRIVCVVPAIPDAAPFQIREGLARRRISATTGECPCGARVDYGDLVGGEVGVAEVHHEPQCPAVTERLAKAIRRWAR